MAKYLQLNWKKCSKPRFIADDRRYSNAVAYNNGYNIIVDEPSELHLLVFDWDTDKGYETEDISDTVRYILGWQKITKQRVESLRKYFSECEFEIRDGRITNVKQLLMNYKN